MLFCCNVCSEQWRYKMNYYRSLHASILSCWPQLLSTFPKSQPTNITQVLPAQQKQHSEMQLQKSSIPEQKVSVKKEVQNSVCAQAEFNLEHYRYWPSDTAPRSSAEPGGSLHAARDMCICIYRMDKAIFQTVHSFTLSQDSQTTIKGSLSACNITQPIPPIH